MKELGKNSYFNLIKTYYSKSFNPIKNKVLHTSWADCGGIKNNCYEKGRGPKVTLETMKKSMGEEDKSVHGHEYVFGGNEYFYNKKTAEYKIKCFCEMKNFKNRSNEYSCKNNHQFFYTPPSHFINEFSNKFKLAGNHKANVLSMEIENGKIQKNFVT